MTTTEQSLKEALRDLVEASRRAKAAEEDYRAEHRPTKQYRLFDEWHRLKVAAQAAEDNAEVLLRQIGFPIDPSL